MIFSFGEVEIPSHWQYKFLEQTKFICLYGLNCHCQIIINEHKKVKYNIERCSLMSKNLTNKSLISVNRIYKGTLSLNTRCILLNIQVVCKEFHCYRFRQSKEVVTMLIALIVARYRSPADFYLPKKSRSRRLKHVYTNSLYPFFLLQRGSSSFCLF
jgi:hypothetical protein